MDALSALPGPAGERYVSLLRRGSLDIEIYAPRGEDTQDPHPQDEVYVVIKGRAIFTSGSRRTQVGPGDLMFVPAGEVHRFEEFTSDFTVWVVFFGPDGGERPDADDGGGQVGQEADQE